MERKIIQLSHDEDNCLIALGNDGTLWFWRSHIQAWEPFAAPLPQAETEPKE